jgi:hypothetical protein
MLLFSSYELHFQWSSISFQLEKHGIFHQGYIWIWIHIICKGFSVHGNICISKFSHVGTWYGLLILDLVLTKWKQHTSIQIKCKTLSMEKNNATTQVVSSHVDNCEKMKEGNCFIHIGIECSKLRILNIDWPFLFWSLFFLNPIFLCNIKFRNNLSFFELLTCRCNCNFGPKDRTKNLLALIEDMGFKKKPFDKGGKTIRKGKSKACVTIESNRGSEKKDYQCDLPSKHYIFSLQFQIYVTTKISTSMQQEIFAMGHPLGGQSYIFCTCFRNFKGLCTWQFAIGAFYFTSDGKASLKCVGTCRDRQEPNQGHIFYVNNTYET